MKIAIAILLCFPILSCKKEYKETVFTLPQKTQSGLHTFGFLLNAEVWVNYGQVCTFYGCTDNLKGRYYPSDGDISISADKVLYERGVRDIHEGFGFSLSTNFRGIGTYSTATNDTLEVAYSYSNVGQPEIYYRLSRLNPEFVVRITKIDQLNKILSGEFSGKLFKRDLFANTISTTDSIMINEGRFDIKIK